MKSAASLVAIAPALLAPLLFGLGAVAAKTLLADVPPVLLAGLLYLGSGLGLGAVLVLRPRSAGMAGLPLERGNMPWLSGAVLCGGIIGPVLLMLGLVRSSASAASLLLNFEAAFTAILAWSMFGEKATAKLALGIGLVLAGGVALSWPESGSGFVPTIFLDWPKMQVGKTV